MDPQQLEEFNNDMKDLHKSMKNIIEIVFATSPLLAISTHGWISRSYHSSYLLRVSFVLFHFKMYIYCFQDFLRVRERPPSSNCPARRLRPESHYCSFRREIKRNGVGQPSRAIFIPEKRTG